MYAFGMMALLGLAVLVVAKIGNRSLRLVPGAWEAVLAALGVGAAWLVDLNLFSAWSIPVRNSEIAVTVTGILVAGFGYLWREVLDVLAGLYRKYTDQARTLEKAENLRRVA